MSESSERYTAALELSWGEFHAHTRHLSAILHKMGPWKGIIAVTRGGLVPASIVARELNIKLIDTYCISSYAHQDQGKAKILKAPEEALKVQGEGWLVIDDLVDSGATFKIIRENLPKAHLAAVYAKPSGEPTTDTYAIPVAQERWIYFPWDMGLSYTKPLAGDD